MKDRVGLTVAVGVAGVTETAMDVADDVAGVASSLLLDVKEGVVRLVTLATSLVTGTSLGGVTSVETIVTQAIVPCQLLSFWNVLVEEDRTTVCRMYCVA